MSEPQSQGDRLKRLNRMLRDFQQLSMAREDLRTQLHDADKKIDRLRFDDLPDLFDEIGVKTIGVEATGNLPEFEAKVGNYYHANIPAGWDSERKRQAFNELAMHGALDLGDTVVSVSFPRSQAKQAEELVQRLQNQGYRVEVSPYIPWSRLTSWLREYCEAGKPYPDLEKIGATVKRIVKINFKDRTF